MHISDHAHVEMHESVWYPLSTSASRRTRVVQIYRRSKLGDGDSRIRKLVRFPMPRTNRLRRRSLDLIECGSHNMHQFAFEGTEFRLRQHQYTPACAANSECPGLQLYSVSRHRYAVCMSVNVARAKTLSRAVSHSSPWCRRRLSRDKSQCNPHPVISFRFVFLLMDLHL